MGSSKVASRQIQYQNKTKQIAAILKLVYTVLVFFSEADETNDIHSVDRCLDRPIYLLVERKLGNAFHWDLPTTITKVKH